MLKRTLFLLINYCLIYSANAFVTSDNVSKAFKLSDSTTSIKRIPFDLNVKEHCQREGEMLHCNMESILSENKSFLSNQSVVNNIKIISNDGLTVKNVQGTDLELDLTTRDRDTFIKIPVYSRLLFSGVNSDGKTEYFLSNALTDDVYRLQSTFSSTELDKHINGVKNSQKIEATKYRFCVRGNYSSTDVSPSNEYYYDREGMKALH